PVGPHRGPQPLERLQRSLERLASGPALLRPALLGPERQQGTTHLERLLQPPVLRNRALQLVDGTGVIARGREQEPPAPSPGRQAPHPSKRFGPLFPGVEKRLRGLEIADRDE